LLCGHSRYHILNEEEKQPKIHILLKIWKVRLQIDGHQVYSRFYLVIFSTMGIPSSLQVIICSLTQIMQ